MRTHFKLIGILYLAIQLSGCLSTMGSVGGVISGISGAVNLMKYAGTKSEEPSGDVERKANEAESSTGNQSATAKASNQKLYPETIREEILSPANQKVTGPRTVSFPMESSPPGVADLAQPEKLVQFAIDLADKGDPAKAAAFLLEAADSEGADSKGNEFRIACAAAAATLYLEAKEIHAFHESVARLRNEMDRFQMAAPDPKIALLLAIADTLAGRRAVVSNQIPWPVQEIFRERTK